jgi:hypothetical protein
MKKIAMLFSILMLSGSMLFAQGIRINFDVISGKRPPNPQEMGAMRAEENAHPNIAKAMHDIEKSLDALNRAPDDFGGNKAQAISDLHQALISLRKALYFRIYQDRR